ncbi:MAG TPA: GWxTD domain-containing protein [Gemmatimonadaceae bacterium]
MRWGTFGRTGALGWLVVAMLLVAGCRSSGTGGTPPGTPPQPAVSRQIPQIPDPVVLYRRMGLLAEDGETPFVGSLSFFAGPTRDSTTLMLTVALANRALQFRREDNHYRATYHVELAIRRGTEMVRQLRGRETVRVVSFRETERTDESVLYRELLKLAPGQYEFRLTVRDEASPRGSAVEATVGVPVLGDGAVSSPVVFYQATPREHLDSLPQVVATPRATAVFGRDSVFSVYVEGYGPEGSFPVSAVVTGQAARTALWADSLALPWRGGLFSGTFAIPVSRLGVGVLTLAVNRLGSPDTLRVPLFVAFGENLPVAEFGDMVNYLRYFAQPGRLAELRNAPPDERAARWAEFVRATDPAPETPEHEGLNAYFDRIAQANTRFREEGTPGWLTDRGRVFVALGSPDQVWQPTVGDLQQRNRTQIWEYRRHHLQLIFIDENGFGRWRMVQRSEGEFEHALMRVLAQANVRDVTNAP